MHTSRNRKCSLTGIHLQGPRYCETMVSSNARLLIFAFQKRMETFAFSP